MPKSEPVDTTVNPTDQWERLNVGLGEEWNFEDFGPLVGNFLGVTTAEVPDPRNPGGMRTTNVYQFSPADEPLSVVFLWGSAYLDLAFADERIRVGDRLRIRNLGDKETKKGTMHNFAIDIPKV